MKGILPVHSGAALLRRRSSEWNDLTVRPRGRALRVLRRAPVRRADDLANHELDRRAAVAPSWRAHDAAHRSRRRIGDVVPISKNAARCSSPTDASAPVPRARAADLRARAWTTDGDRSDLQAGQRRRRRWQPLTLARRHRVVPVRLQHAIRRGSPAWTRPRSWEKDVRGLLGVEFVRDFYQRRAVLRLTERGLGNVIGFTVSVNKRAKERVQLDAHSRSGQRNYRAIRVRTASPARRRGSRAARSVPVQLGPAPRGRSLARPQI